MKKFPFSFIYQEKKKINKFQCHILSTMIRVNEKELKGHNSKYIFTPDPPIPKRRAFPRGCRIIRFILHM